MNAGTVISARSVSAEAIAHCSCCFTVFMITITIVHKKNAKDSRKVMILTRSSYPVHLRETRSPSRVRHGIDIQTLDRWSRSIGTLKVRVESSKVTENDATSVEFHSYFPRLSVV